jgi:hypothetical protein
MSGIRRRDPPRGQGETEGYSRYELQQMPTNVSQFNRSDSVFEENNNTRKRNREGGSVKQQFRKSLKGCKSLGMLYALFAALLVSYFSG